MNEAGSRFAALLPKWIRMTHDADIGFPFTEPEISEAAEALSRTLREGRIPTDHFEPSAANLTIVSVVCGKLSNETPSEAVLVEAERAHQLVSSIALDSDPLGEIPELLCHLSYIAWRASRGLGLPITAANWQVAFDKSFGRGSAFQIQCSSLVGETQRTISEPSQSRVSACVSDPVILFAVCSLLRERRDGSPGHALVFAKRLHAFLAKTPLNLLATERSYFLGETALTVSGSARLCGDMEAALEWLKVAETKYRELPQPDELIAAILYTRITIAFESTDHSYVLSRIDSLVEWYRLAGLRRCVAKSLYLKGDALKLLGKLQEAEQVWKTALGDLAEERDLRAALLGRMGELRTIRGEFVEALDFLLQAKAITDELQMPMVSGNIEVMFGELYRQQQKWDEAFQFFYRGLAQFASVDMKAMVARVRVQIAEALLASGHLGKAERELRLVLPELTRLRIIPESLVAVALLREIANQRTLNRRSDS